tara:strand:+ start:153 stop:1127 length:975 start_codon:yes stop_codon:yes gene_type:complete
VKKFLFNHFLLFLLFCINFIQAQKKVDFINLEYHSGNLYYGRENEPFTGFTFSFYENSEVKRFEGQIRNGRMDGKWKFYYENGSIMKLGHFQSADPKFLFSNINNIIIPPYKNRSGTWREFHIDGSKNTYGRFIKGKRWGIHAFFGYQDGLMMRTYYKNNLKNGYEFVFLDNKKIHTNLYKNGINLRQPLTVYNEGKRVISNPFESNFSPSKIGKQNSLITETINEPMLADMNIRIDSGLVKHKDPIIESINSKLELMKKPNVILNPEKKTVKDLYPNKLNQSTTKVTESNQYIPFKTMFRSARKAGVSIFTWQGSLYNTKLKN